jgi:hypothetical protein
MNCKKLFPLAIIAACSLVAVVRSVATAEPSNDSKPSGQPEFKLPPGWTADDMKACMLAGTPGKMHERLAKGSGKWEGKNTMWMFPGADPIKSDCSSIVTPMMEGRFTKCEMAGDMPGMGPYNGIAIYGFDNVSQKFVCTMIDNHNTGMMNGTGELSSDGTTITWNFTFSCPITGKPAVMRQIEKITGPDTMSLEMFAADPKSGKEFKMMAIDFMKKK